MYQVILTSISLVLSMSYVGISVPNNGSNLKTFFCSVAQVSGSGRINHGKVDLGGMVSLAEPGKTVSVEPGFLHGFSFCH